MYFELNDLSSLVGALPAKLQHNIAVKTEHNGAERFEEG